MSFGRVWLLRFALVIAGLVLLHRGLIHANYLPSEPWAVEIVIGILTAQMVFYVPNPVSNTDPPGARTITIPLNMSAVREYERTGKIPKFPKLKKYRPAHNRKLPYYTGKSAFGKYMTHRAWKAKKRREAKALQDAARVFLMGCSQTPVRDFGVLLEKINTMRLILSVKNWGR